MVKVKLKTFLLHNWLIILIWVLALFLRCYRQSQLLGFYYDQGRDAKIAADILTGKNFPAIGPTTGIEGLYLGPFWFYLITPGYFIGQGDPAIASYFIAFLESLTIPLIFYLLKIYWRLDTAYLASIIWAFSHYLIRSSRWFSNPSPLPTLALLSMILLVKIIKEKKYKLIPYLAISIGISLQLEAASAVFFIPAIIILFFTEVSTLSRIKLSIWIKSIISFGVLLLPQLAFEVKNKFLITKNFIGFLTGKVNSNTGRSWAFPDFDFLIKRLTTYYQTYFSKLDTNITNFSLMFLVVFVIGLIYLIVRYRHNIFVKIQLLWLLVPSFILLFFVGNYGTLYDYYLTGFFPAFIILFSIIITLFKNKLFYIFLLSMTFIYFFQGNYIQLKNYLSANPDGPLHITLGNEISSVDLVCKLNSQTSGNFDVYVPPVIAHSYEYLISWRQRQGKCLSFDSNRNSTVYIIYEVDPPHPERLSNWLSKYKSDKIVLEKRYGGITVLQLERNQ